jgi:hypothetical protein
MPGDKIYIRIPVCVWAIPENNPFFVIVNFVCVKNLLPSVNAHLFQGTSIRVIAQFAQHYNTGII